VKTTFGRQFITTAGILLLAVLLLGTACQFMVREYLVDDILNDLYSDAKTLSLLASAYDALRQLDDPEFRINLRVASEVSGADAVICNSAGKVVLCSCQELSCAHLGLTVNKSYYQKVISSQRTADISRIQGLYDDARYIVSVPVLKRNTDKAIGMVMVSVPMSSSVLVLTAISDIFLFTSLLVIVAAVIAVSVLARSQCRPLRELARAASAFGHGDLSARVKMENTATQEVEEMALAFNNMADSLEKSEYQRREFVANVSHELKTPMTTIGGYVDGVLDGTIPPEKARHYLQIVSDETKRLSRLVRSMLEISRVQDTAGIPDEKKTRFDVEECVGQVLVTFEQKINARNLEVEVDMPPHPLYTRADRDAITQVVYNLLDNAVKFCTPGGVLGVRIRDGGEKIYISISNQGETIPPEELPMVFERFHKLDKSRSINRDGWGLGLYIVKTIIGSHGENISVTSRDGCTAFTFTLPLVS
jgi:signal transduction histidine kinase